MAVFGAKDWQQAAVIQRMARDLNFPVKLVVARTVREPDGLAMSSRNLRLTGALRRRALVLWHSIQEARAAIERSGGSVPAVRLAAQVRKRMGTGRAARLDYVEFFDPETLEPVSRVGPGTHMALAVFVGGTRLIDNARL